MEIHQFILGENWVEVAGKARPAEPLHEISVCLQSTALMHFMHAVSVFSVHVVTDVFPLCGSRSPSWD